MNRRDFLLFRRERDLRIVELSCRTLYMRYLDAQVAGTPPADAEDASDPWHHEPPAVLSRRTVSDLCTEISESLRDADVLRVRDEAWLREPAVREHVQTAIDAFVARGGRVEFVQP
jgi:hypothetical protein